MAAAPLPSAQLPSDADVAQQFASGSHRAGGVKMDRAFISTNQIVERYLSGRLPRKGAQEFEQFCREHPELLEELGLAEQIHAALRLLEAGGQAAPWEEKPRRWWEQPAAFAGAAGLCVVLAVLALLTSGRLSAAQRAVDALQSRVAAQPLDPAESTRSIVLIPSRTAPSEQSLVTIGGGAAEFADLKIDVAWSKFSAFQVTVDRVDQGRVAVLRGLMRDSNGDLRMGFNSSALGPGQYQLTIEGLNWRGETVPQGWASFTIMH